MWTAALRVVALLILPGLTSPASFTPLGDLPGGIVYVPSIRAMLVEPAGLPLMLTTKAPGERVPA
jgi:hypothetical protein